MPRLKNYYPGSAGWAPLVDLDSVKAVCDQHGLNEEQTDRALNAVDLFVLKTASRQDGLTAADAKAHLEGLAAAMKQAAHALGPLTRANALIMRLEYEDWQVLDALN